MSTSSQLTRKEKDFLRLVKSGCHIGSVNVNSSLQRFIAHKTNYGVPIIDLVQTYDKIKLAARIIAAQKQLSDVIVVSSREAGQRAVIKFAHYTGCKATQDARWTPGVLTNYQTKKFQEPRLMVVADPFADRKAIIESSYMNIPVIALVNTDSNLQYVDVAIPCNNKTTESISMIFWILAREVQILTRKLEKNDDWEELVDLFYHKTLEDVKKHEKEVAELEAAGDEDGDEEGGDWDDNEDGEAGSGDEDNWGDDENADL